MSGHQFPNITVGGNTQFQAGDRHTHQTYNVATQYVLSGDVNDEDRIRRAIRQAETDISELQVYVDRLRARLGEAPKYDNNDTSSAGSRKALETGPRPVEWQDDFQGYDWTICTLTLRLSSNFEALNAVQSVRIREEFMVKPPFEYRVRGLDKYPLEVTISLAAGWHWANDQGPRMDVRHQKLTYRIARPPAWAIYSRPGDAQQFENSWVTPDYYPPGHDHSGLIERCTELCR